MQDHSDLYQKIALRDAAMGQSSPRHVLDCYAGEGVIAGMLWLSRAASVTCIERNPAKAARIDPRARVIVGDNRDHVSIAADADVIDCDAHGLVTPLIERIAGLARPGTLVIFTDGSPSAAKRWRAAERSSRRKLTDLLTDLHIETSPAGTALYGYGWTK